MLTPWADPLPVPPVVAARSLKLQGLVAANSSHSFHSELPAGPTFGYNGESYLGPTIVATRGEKLEFTATNNLGPHPLAGSIDTALHGALASDATAPRMAVHLHGGNVEPKSDGYPEDSFNPGQTRPYIYVNDQQAGNIWYHDHALGITRLNVYAGLAAGYLLRDRDDTGNSATGLRLPSGDFELPLIIQDRRFNADGSLYFTPAPWAPEFFGDVATVNGKAWPNLDVRQGLYRFRIYNGSNARFYNLSLSNRQQLIQIGTDTGLLDAPVPLPALLLGPGERADVLLDFKAVPVGTTLILQNDAGTPFPSNSPKSPRGGGNPLPQIMRFRVVAGAGNNLAVPTALRGTGFANPSVAAARASLTAAATRQRIVTLVEIPGPAGPLVVLLNYVYWDEAAMDSQLEEKPVADTVELWNIVNLTVDTHPIHLHLVQFLIQDRQNLQTTQYMRAYAATGPRTVMPGMVPPPAGGPTVAGGYPPPDPAPFLQQRPIPPAANEAGWKDTVQVPPGMVTRILVPFGARAAANLPFGKTFRGRYVWHCHILDHEDNEMMLPYDVV